MATQVDFRDENGNMVAKTVELTHRKLHLIRGEVSAGPIELPDAAVDETGWYQILDVSKDCVHFDESHIGSWVFLPELGIGESFMVGKGERIIRETWFEKVGGPPMAVFQEI